MSADVAPAAVPASPSDSLPRPLRLWPAVVILAIEWALLTIPGWFAQGTFLHMHGMFEGPMVGTLCILIWWLFASRAAWKDRWLVLGTFIATTIAVGFVCDPSVWMLLVLFGLPVVTTLWVAWLVLTRGMTWPARRAGLLATIVLALSYFTLLRVDGVSGAIDVKTSWRWSLTREQQFLQARAKSATGGGAKASAEIESAPALILEPGDWPEFRGPNRDNRAEGVTISDDWSVKPPKLLWKHEVGPGWGAFSVVGGRLFTQEQRGEDEAVVCYRAEDGAELWTHVDKARFEEVIAGAGPRGTPTFHEGRLYTVGGRGRVNCLDAATGKAIWGADMVGEEVPLPAWGYSSSPLVVGDVVVVLPGQPTGKAAIGYDRNTGERLWAAGEGTHTYASPQLATFDGVPQVLCVTDAGVTSFVPTSGEILWHYSWQTEKIHRILQPYVDGDGVILCTYFGVGSRRVTVSHTDGVWSAKTDWEAKDFKPYFNDFVVSDGYLYGFDANIFCCFDLKTGRRAWRGGRYGYGQVLLLPDQKLLLVLSEAGEAVLLKADPKKHTEVTKYQVLEGKTWNHPVVVRGKLYVRNAEEMACFDVAPPQRVAESQSR